MILVMSDHILSLLVAERSKIEAAIAALQGSIPTPSSVVIEDGSMPDWVKSKAQAPKKRTMSAAGRKRIAEATRARWAKVRAAKAEAAAPATTKGKKAILAAVAPPEDADFKSRMSIAMKAAWAKRKKAGKKKAANKS
jgi:hypothetical protein